MHSFLAPLTTLAFAYVAPPHLPPLLAASATRTFNTDSIVLFERPQSQLAVTRQYARHGALKAVAAEENELSIKELLTQYGVIALLFHFTVWITSLTTVFLLFNFGLDIDGLLPDWLMSGEAAAEGAEGATAALGMGGKAAATLAVVEAVGPARLALTVAATPKVSEKAREYQVVRDLLAVCARAARRGKRLLS